MRKIIATLVLCIMANITFAENPNSTIKSNLTIDIQANSNLQSISRDLTTAKNNFCTTHSTTKPAIKIQKTDFTSLINCSSINNKTQITIGDIYNCICESNGDVNIKLKPITTFTPLSGTNKEQFDKINEFYNALNAIPNFDEISAKFTSAESKKNCAREVFDGEKSYQKTDVGICTLFFPDCGKSNNLMSTARYYRRIYNSEPNDEFFCFGHNSDGKTYDFYTELKIEDINTAFDIPEQDNFINIGISFYDGASEYLKNNCPRVCTFQCNVPGFNRNNYSSTQKAENACNLAKFQCDAKGFNKNNYTNLQDAQKGCKDKYIAEITEYLTNNLREEHRLYNAVSPNNRSGYKNHNDAKIKHYATSANSSLSVASSISTYIGSLDTKSIDELKKIAHKEDGETKITADNINYLNAQQNAQDRSLAEIKRQLAIKYEEICTIYQTKVKRRQSVANDKATIKDFAEIILKYIEATGDTEVKSSGLRDCNKPEHTGGLEASATITRVFQALFSGREERAQSITYYVNELTK